MNKNLEEFSDKLHHLHIAKAIDSIEKEVSSLIEENNMLRNREESEEISKLEKELENTMKNALVIFTDGERQMESDFCSDHHIHCNTISFTYNITFSGLGTAVTVTCPVCGESKDISDIK